MTYPGRKKLEQHTAVIINPIILVALLDKVTADLNSKPKIIKGRNNAITDFIVRLVEYKVCFNTRGMIGSNNIIEKIVDAKINGIL
ncbi:hypothetical protein [unidentified bacterial endosymbiont]|uniref:hypothetical protein n=1 Tax=unidentified bacterial endosymbiont TaxID=2355 RepID=UPI00209D2D25|nr:hypothetical protein [unidentified bacterial endosymbiont]